MRPGRHLQGAGLALLVWLGALIPFHRLPLPEGYAAASLSLALALCVVGALCSLRTRSEPLLLAPILPAVAMLAVVYRELDAIHQRWLGPLMILLAAIALLHIVRANAARSIEFAAELLKQLAIGCVLAVLLLMPFLPTTRLRMPLLTATAMLMLAALAHWLRARARR